MRDSFFQNPTCVHQPERGKRHARGAGFTLIELMVVLVLIALSTQLIMPAFGNDIPKAAVRADAENLASTIHYIRSEARLRASVYQLEIDLTKNCFQILLPAEVKVQHEYDETEDWGENGAPTLGWTYLSGAVKFSEVNLGQRSAPRGQLIKLRFDSSGRTGQMIISLTHKFEEDVQYSIFVPPLTGEIVVKPERIDFPKAADHDF